jgi:hypothetical protein
MLCGCSSIFPSSPKFPNVPDELTKKCPELGRLEEVTKLSEVAKSVSNNYTLYHECSAKNDLWIQWYNKQKEIFEKVN